MKRILIVSAVLIAMLVGLADMGQAAPSGDADEEFKQRVDGFFGKSIHWKTDPVPVTATDPAGDQAPGNPASAGFAPLEADVLGFGLARTSALDDATFAALWGTGGLLTEGSTGVFYPQTFDVDTAVFRQGVQITWLRAGAAPPAMTGSDSFAVGAEYFDPAYPAPPSGTFQGINKVHRFELTANGGDLTLRQFDGAKFGTYRTDTIVATTCTAGSSGACDWFFVSALSNPEFGNAAGRRSVRQVTDVEQAGGSLFRKEGEKSADDHADLTPVAGNQAGDLAPGAAPAQPAPQSSASQSSSSQASASSSEVAAAPPSSGDSGGSNPLAIALLLLGFLALVGGGVALAKRDKPKDEDDREKAREERFKKERDKAFTRRDERRRRAEGQEDIEPPSLAPPEEAPPDKSVLRFDREDLGPT